MGLLIGFLTVVLVIDCLLLMLLVLIQLPKKEAGMGQAFGGAATDALFGAGSGTALTKMTKYTAGIFFGLTLCLSILNAQQSKHRRTAIEEGLQQVAKEAATSEPVPAATTTTTATATSAPATGAVTLTLATNLQSLISTTNEANKPATNAPPVTPPNAAAPPNPNAPAPAPAPAEKPKEN